jgi:hemerythrin-like metal-binding protein
LQVSGFIYFEAIHHFPEGACAMEQTREEKGLSVGVKMMDRDHMEISEMVLELNLDAAAGRPWDHTGRILKDMARALSSHFAMEQTLMDSTRYPGATIHHLRHEWMIDQMRVLATRSKKDGIEANQMLLALLSESHFAHMQTDDMRYGLWLNGEVARPAGAAEGILFPAAPENIEAANGVRAQRPTVFVEQIEQPVGVRLSERELVDAGRR